MNLKLQAIICTLHHFVRLHVCTFMPVTEAGSGKFLVKASDDTILQNRGRLNDREIAKIQAFIKDNYKEMYKRWSEYCKLGFYGSND